jgi:hypothetical protein
MNYLEFDRLRIEISFYSETGMALQSKLCGMAVLCFNLQNQKNQAKSIQP